MQSRGRGQGPGLGALGDFGVGSRGWDFAGKPSSGSCGGSPGTARRAPGQPRAGEQLRKVEERKEAESQQSGRAQRRCWAGRGVPREPGSPSPGALHEAASVPGGELTLWKEKSNCSLPKDAKLRRPVSSQRAPASARRAEPQSPPGPAGWEPGAFQEAEAPVHGSDPECVPVQRGGVRGYDLGAPSVPLRAMPPAPRAPRERREHGEVE